MSVWFLRSLGTHRPQYNGFGLRMERPSVRLRSQPAIRRSIFSLPCAPAASDLAPTQEDPFGLAGGVNSPPDCRDSAPLIPPCVSPGDLTDLNRFELLAILIVFDPPEPPTSVTDNNRHEPPRHGVTR
jgi:hypothetical protein